MSNTTETNTSPWTGTNLYGQILLLIASLFGGMSQDTAGLIVAAVAAVIAAVLAARNWVVKAKFNLDKSWVTDPNNIAYLTAVLVGVSPKLGELVPGAVDLFNAMSSGNWGNIISGLVSFGTMIYYSYFKKK